MENTALAHSCLMLKNNSSKISVTPDQTLSKNVPGLSWSSVVYNKNVSAVHTF